MVVQPTRLKTRAPRSGDELQPMADRRRRRVGGKGMHHPRTTTTMTTTRRMSLVAVVVVVVVSSASSAASLATSRPSVLKRAQRLLLDASATCVDCRDTREENALVLTMVGWVSRGSRMPSRVSSMPWHAIRHASCTNTSAFPVTTHSLQRACLRSSLFPLSHLPSHRHVFSFPARTHQLTMTRPCFVTNTRRTSITLDRLQRTAKPHDGPSVTTAVKQTTTVRLLCQRNSHRS